MEFGPAWSDEGSLRLVQKEPEMISALEHLVVGLVDLLKQAQRLCTCPAGRLSVGRQGRIAEERPVEEGLSVQPLEVLMAFGLDKGSELPPGAGQEDRGA